MKHNLLVAALLFLACTTPVADPASLQGREWRLVWTERFPTIPAQVKAPTLRFEANGNAAGNTGCNSAGGDYTVEGDRITFGPLMSTKRACVEPEANAIEAAYMRALGETRKYRINGDRLELLDASDRVVARFE